MPTCVVITHVFGFKVRYEADALGLPGLGMLLLPHPVGQRPVAEVAALADRSFDELRFILTHPPEEVEAMYRGRTEPRSFERPSVHHREGVTAE